MEETHEIFRSLSTTNSQLLTSTTVEAPDDKMVMDNMIQLYEELQKKEQIKDFFHVKFIKTFNSKNQALAFYEGYKESELVKFN